MRTLKTPALAHSLESLRDTLRQFAAEREWDQFHSPKNLAIALSVEASELLEHFQWITEPESKMLAPEKIDEVRDELADVLIYLIRLSDKLAVNLLEAAFEKVRKNVTKYPAEKVRGSSKKYTDS
jgi:NTP pyrophosphatase (non-canonical NTP hydrolase)